MDVQGSFAGGMVSQSHPEKLRDDQSQIMENADIIQGGVTQSRGAYSKTNDPSTPISGLTQGKWRYANLAGGTDIVAINGNLYSVVNNSYTKIPITGLTNGFQTSREINAVQLRDKMYFATGSGIVVYDGSTASLTIAYAPNGLEALYIGTNGYSATPDTYLSDMTGAADVILGVIPDQRYGVINQNVNFTCYIEQISGDSLEYLWEIKQILDADYIVSQTWSTSKQWVGNFATKADYMVRVSMRKAGTTAVLSQYVLPKYKVQTTADEKPEPSISFANMSTCNKILIHYDRMMLYGDTTNPDFLYISHLNKFDYFPRTNIIKVTDPLRGALNAVVRYKDFLVCFTDGSIQGINGTQPTNYELFPIHTTIGAKFPYSVQIMKNYIAFVGTDNAIYYLKSFNYASDDKLNIDRLDVNIMDVVGGLLQTATRVLSCIYNNQYYLYIENSGTNYIYRYYYELGVWVRDNIGALQFKTLNTYQNILMTTSLNGGKIYQLKSNVFKDDVSTPYNMRILSKDYDFSLPLHRKKLKQFQLMAKITNATTINVSLYADNTLITTTPLTYDSTQNTDAQKLKVMAAGRFRYVKYDISIPVNEQVQLIGYGFVFKYNTPK
jgi:hypothetical protein